MRVAYCDHPVTFQHALQGIHGPKQDRALLKFLAAYLYSPLARYFLFHTTSSWGVSKAKVHLEELLTIPFPPSERTLNSKRGSAIIAEAAKIIDDAMEQAGELLVDRKDLVRTTRERINPLVYEYFDLDDGERTLVEDTNNVVIPSTRPTRASDKVPTLRLPTSAERGEYLRVLCATLNDWAREGRYRIEGRTLVSAKSGVGAVELTKVNGKKPSAVTPGEDRELLAVLDRLRKTFSKQLGSVELLRGVKVFDKDTAYLFKPLRLRFWTRTAALNDADAIAASILSCPSRGET
jgi:hypothetical protein